MQKINFRFQKWLGLFCCLFLVACASKQQNLDNIDTTNLTQLENVKFQKISRNKGAEFSKLRERALKDTALSLGAQAGLAYATSEINNQLERDGKHLDAIFNFNAMMLSHGVLPPVLVQGDNLFNLDDPNTIRVADRTYKIAQQARFATTPPNWREYLKLTYSKPELPDRTLLPRNDEEQKAWKDGLRKGWESGLEQARNIFQQDLARLKRDFNGMVLYRKLLTERMVSQPFVSRAELGITGDESEMRINDQVLRIVELPKLQTESHRWHPVVIKHE